LLTLSACVLAAGCAGAVAPIPFEGEPHPEQLNAQQREMYEAEREIAEKGIENVPMETIMKTVGVAGPKLQQREELLKKNGIK
jgi:hypothetical protein